MSTNKLNQPILRDILNVTDSLTLIEVSIRPKNSFPQKQYSGLLRDTDIDEIPYVDHKVSYVRTLPSLEPRGFQTLIFHIEEEPIVDEPTPKDDKLYCECKSPAHEKMLKEVVFRYRTTYIIVYHVPVIVCNTADITTPVKIIMRQDACIGNHIRLLEGHEELLREKLEEAYTKGINSFVYIDSDNMH